jgi:hypothetical protein
MTREEQDRMNELCKRIAFEKDPKAFDQLVRELDELLESSESASTFPQNTSTDNSDPVFLVPHDRNMSGIEIFRQCTSRAAE